MRWRGRSSQQDRSHARHNLGQGTTPEDAALVGELRAQLHLSLDDICKAMRRCVNPAPAATAPFAGSCGGWGWRGAFRVPVPARFQRFEDTRFGFVHIDLKYPGKLKGQAEYAFVAMKRVTRIVHVQVVVDRRIATIAAALTRFLHAFAHPVHTILTPFHGLHANHCRAMDNGSEFTDRFSHGAHLGGAPRATGKHALDVICARAGIDHRLTCPCRPQTNAMVKRFNRRLATAFRDLTPARASSRHRTRFKSHAERQTFILNFVRNCNHTRLRCPNYQAPVILLLIQTEDNTGWG